MAASTTQTSGNVALPKLGFSLTGAAPYTAIAELVEPAVPEITSDQYDTTNTDITDNFKTFIAGWSETGEAGYTVNYREDTYEQLLALVGVDAQWELSYTDPAHSVTDSTIVFDGSISGGPTPDMPIDDKWSIGFSIKGSGAPTFTPGTDA